MDDICGTRVATKAKPSTDDKTQKNRSWNLGLFFNLFNKRPSSKSLNRSESAALEKLKTSISLPGQENTEKITISASPNDSYKKNIFDESDPNSPALISLKENLQFQADSTISFAPKDSFDMSIKLSLEVIANARINYNSASPNNIEGRGQYLAGLLDSLGDIYKSIGSFEDAINCFSEALRIRKDTNSTFQSIASAWTNLGLACCEVQKFDEGYDCFEQAHSALLRHHGNDQHPDVASCLGNMGVALRGICRMTESTRMGEEAVKLMEELCGKSDLNTLQQKSLMAVSLRLAGDPALSAHMLEKVIKTVEKKYDLVPSHPWVSILRFEHRKAYQDSSSLNNSSSSAAE